MKVEEVTEDDCYEIMVWYREREIVHRLDCSREMAQALAADHTGEGFNGRY